VAFISILLNLLEFGFSAIAYNWEELLLVVAFLLQLKKNVEHTTYNAVIRTFSLLISPEFFVIYKEEFRSQEPEVRMSNTG
jgi:hypothetical protein